MLDFKSNNKSLFLKFLVFKKFTLIFKVSSNLIFPFIILWEIEIVALWSTPLQDITVIRTIGNIINIYVLITFIIPSNLSYIFKHTQNLLFSNFI